MAALGEDSPSAMVLLLPVTAAVDPLMLKLVEVTAVKGLSEAVTVYAPGRLIERLLNVATPLTAAKLDPPLRTAPAVPVAMVRPTLELSLVTMLP